MTQLGALPPRPPPNPPRLARWLVESRLPAKVEQNIQRICASEDVRHVALMPDLHLGRLANNGMVVATTDLIYPQAVGSDIGCGFSAIAFESDAAPLREPALAEKIIRTLYKIVPALKQRGTRALPDDVHPSRLTQSSLVRKGEREGARQLGTLGCGNHFVELQQNVAGQLWLMVHSGSRAMGQGITDFHLAKAPKSVTGLQFLDLRTPEGQAYFSDMQWAVQYATKNRLALLAHVAEALEQLVGIRALQPSYVNSPHNFARREEHFGTSLIVHRKSAASARDGELGLVAGSMGTPSYLVSGRGQPDSLCSCAHGAGRTMGRTEARQRIRARDMQRQLAQVRFDSRNLDALRDEAPGAYRDIREVMRAQQELTRQVDCLTPILNFKYPDPR